MELIETILLALVQGLTEFIPVSSSGHVVLGQNFFSGASDRLFLEFIHIGTLLSLLIYYRKKIMQIIRQVFVQHDIVLARNIFLGALPAGLVGLFLGDFIAGVALFGGVLMVISVLAIVGVIMIVLERLPKAKELEDLGKLSWHKALVIGVFQLLAFIPGVSRSGSTIITGRLAGLKSTDAAEYSFLVSIPLMTGLAVKLFLIEGDRQYFVDNIAILIIGNVVAFVAGLLAVGFLIQYLQKNSLAVFGWYRLGLSVVMLGIFLLQ